MDLKNGWLSSAHKTPSPFYNQRPENCNIELLVIHNISLPPGQFGGPYIEQLFTGKLSASEHPSFESIHQMQVSAHLLVRRDGSQVQFVSFNDRAWHAGLSSFQGRSNCNDYSIGIELEGTDDLPYTQDQYKSLIAVSGLIMRDYPAITLGRVVGHTDIAPKRKSDPGQAFNWPMYRQQLCHHLSNEEV